MTFPLIIQLPTDYMNWATFMMGFVNPPENDNVKRFTNILVIK